MFKSPIKLVALLMIAFLMHSCSKDNLPQPPTAKAGKADTITLPVDSVELTGTGTGNGSKVVAYLWSQVSGPSTAIISDQGAPSTIVSGLIQGRYVFQLMVTDDKGLTGVDTTSVLVNPSPIKTLVLQPANNPFDYGLSEINGVNASGVADWSVAVMSWTYNGQSYTIRPLIKFDLTSIPSTATVQSAKLYLYSNPNPKTGNQSDANFGTSNAMLVQRVTSMWSPGTATWTNQPSGDAASQIIVPATSSSMLDLNLDVTAQVTAMVANQANYGFLMKLQTEVPYNSRIFVASDNSTYPDKHPKLVVTYK